MNTPITSKFFKKIELYQELVFQDRLFKKSLKDPDQTHQTKSTWEVEKKVLYWTRWGHKHLGSPLVTNRFKTDYDLQDMKLTQKEAEVAGIRELMQNLVQRGFAKYVDEQKREDAGILISDKGLLAGALVYEIYKPKLITKQRIWNKYKGAFSSETFLSHKFRHWFYGFIIAIGWLVFAAAVVLVLWSLGEKISGQ